MTAFPKVFSFPRRRKIFTLSLVLIFVALAFETPGNRVAAQKRGSAQLRTAVATNSESELQKIESAFAGTETAALAKLLRGYLRLQAKDYAAATGILNDTNIARLTSLGDYAAYYRGQALQELGRTEDAEREFRRLSQTYPTSLLARTAALQAAGSALTRGDYQNAVDTVSGLVAKNDGTALKLRADALEKLGRTNEAVLTLRKLYFDAPQSPEAEKVGQRLAELGGSTAAGDVSQLRARADKPNQRLPGSRKCSAPFFCSTAD